jgi:hypothetical protein
MKCRAKEKPESLTVIFGTLKKISSDQNQSGNEIWDPLRFFFSLWSPLKNTYSNPSNNFMP